MGNRDGGRWRGLLILAIVLLCLPAWNRAKAVPQGGTTHTVVIKQMRFNPPQLNVKVGDTVEWKNEDIYSHTATANDGRFDSGLIDPGKAWSTTITAPGDIGYHCRPHPNMVAAIAASGASGGAPGNRVSLAFEFPHKPHEIHPILVNFTAALLPLALLSDMAGRLLRRRSLQHVGFWLVLYEAAITPLTVAAGWWWRSALGANLHPPLITVHQWLGTAAAVLFIGLAAWRWSLYKRELPASTGYLACAFIAVLALAYQGSIGGVMVFGR
jgi:plastocyanin/uncharacterized membrane protein